MSRFRNFAEDKEAMMISSVVQNFPYDDDDFSTTSSDDEDAEKKEEVLLLCDGIAAAVF